MSSDLRAHARAFVRFLPSIVKLDQLQEITENLDKELAESQRIMKEIRTMFDNVSKVSAAKQGNCNEPPANVDISNITHEDISKFLEADVPKFCKGTLEIDNIEDIIAPMKKYAEDLKKNVLYSQPQKKSYQREFENLDIRQYATTLDQLAKRLANIKLNKKDEIDNRNALLEEKLSKLCQDVNLFTQMVETKTAISDCNKNWPDKHEDNNILYYDNIINKLLAGINEVTYLLKSKN